MCFKDLYCGSADGCAWVLTDLRYAEAAPRMGAGAAHDFGRSESRFEYVLFVKSFTST